MSAQITGKDIHGMVTHWLKTPVNGYLGSDYGQDAMSLLQVPMTDTSRADAYIAKLRTDIDVIGVLPSGAVNLFPSTTGTDSKGIQIGVCDQLIPIEGGA